MGWAASCTLQVGNWHLGVRSNTAEADDLVRTVLSEHIVDGVDAPANYSARRAASAPGERTRGLHLLFRSHQLVARSPSFGQVLHVLCRQLQSYDSDPTDQLRLSATTLITKGGGAVVLPAEFSVELHHLRSRLRLLGLRTLDVPHADLDRETGHVIVSPLGGRAEAQLRHIVDVEGSKPDWVEPGRYPVRAWVFRLDPEVGLTRSGAVVAATRQVVNRPGLDGAAMLRTLAASLRSADCVRLGGFGAVELLDRLRSLDSS